MNKQSTLCIMICSFSPICHIFQVRLSLVGKKDKLVCGAENKTKKLQREIHVAGKQENSKMEMIMALG